MMTWVLVAALIVVCLLNGIFLDQAHRRLCRASVRWADALNSMHERNIDYTRELLQRIQAPEQAVAEHSNKPRGDTPLYLAPDDDEAWNEAHGRGD